MSADGAWAVVGHEEAGRFATEEEAVAAAWTVTPAGGKRPEVRFERENRVLIRRERENDWVDVGIARELRIEQVMSDPDKLGVVLTDIEHRLEGIGGEAVLRAEVRMPMSRVEQFLGDVSGDTVRRVLGEMTAQMVRTRFTDLRERVLGSSAAMRDMYVRNVATAVEYDGTSAGPGLRIPYFAVDEPRAVLVVSTTLRFK